MADRTLIPGNWLPDGSRPFLHRAVVFITGQGDELETPQGCFGGCHQGRKSCDCHATEMACDVAPDASRTFGPAPMPRGMRAKVNALAVAFAVAGFSLLAALLGITDPRFTP